MIHARADALFSLGIVTGIAPAKGMQPDKHHSLFLSSALFDLNLTTRGRSSCSSRLAAGSMGASPWLMRLLTAASAAGVLGPRTVRRSRSAAMMGGAADRSRSTLPSKVEDLG